MKIFYRVIYSFTDRNLIAGRVFQLKRRDPYNFLFCCPVVCYIYVLPSHTTLRISSAFPDRFQPNFWWKMVSILYTTASSLQQRIAPSDRSSCDTLCSTAV